MNLMFHPYAQVYGYVEEPTDSNRAPPTCLWSKEFYETDTSRGFVRGYAIQFGRGIGPVVEAIMSEGKGILPWGADHHQRLSQAQRSSAGGGVGDLRGSAGGAQPRHPRSRADGQPRAFRRRASIILSVRTARR